MRIRSPWFTWIVGPGHEPLKLQQSIVFQGAIFLFTGSAVIWKTFTPFSIVNGTSSTSGVITGAGVELLGRFDARVRLMPNRRPAPPKPAAAVIALCINVRRELTVPLYVGLL